MNNKKVKTFPFSLRKRKFKKGFFLCCCLGKIWFGFLSRGFEKSLKNLICPFIGHRQANKKGNQKRKTEYLPLVIIKQKFKAMNF
jgi:hypothetical protein